jgi:hypothetical protein
MWQQEILMWRQTLAQKWISKLHISQIVTKVATEKPLSPQLWLMWRQSEFGWTPLV